jgi:catechol 2,3-dioxygenase-like lactoylglutathione lyase family enzyme
MHLHLNVSNPDEHKQFWTLLGGTIVTVGTSPADVVRFPNVLIFLTHRPPSGGTKGTTVNHVGFGVQNIRAMVDTVKAAGYPLVTRAELPAAQAVDGDLAYIADQQNNVAFVMGPDEAKVEFIEVKGLPSAIAMHHIHFASPQVGAMQAWYVQVFGAKPRMRGSFAAADLPGVNLTWSPAPAGVTGTSGRALDHIGFEMPELGQFCRRLEAMGIELERPYTTVPPLDIATAFMRDPWGTGIELTEGLARVR